MKKVAIGVVLGTVIATGAYILVATKPWAETLSIVNNAIVQVNEVALLRQNSNYSSIDVIKRLTEAAVYYKWESDNAWGVVFTDWTPDPSLKDGVLTITAPPLVYFGPNVDLSEGKFVTQIVNRSAFVDEEERKDTFIQTRMNSIVCEHALLSLESESFRSLAKQSLQGFFFNLLGSLDQLAEPIRRVEVNFANPGSAEDVSGRCNT